MIREGKDTISMSTKATNMKGGDHVFLNSRIRLFLLRDIDEKRGRYTDRRVGTNYRTEEESQRKSLQTLWSKEEHRENHDEDREGGEYRSPHGIVDGFIDHLSLSSRREFVLKQEDCEGSDKVHLMQNIALGGGFNISLSLRHLGRAATGLP